MTAVAIIPALTASNIALERPFAGRPLLAQTIAQARLCPAISAVVVVTDDAVLARIAKAAGARVIAAPGNSDASNGNGARTAAQHDGGHDDRAAAMAAEVLGAEAGTAGTVNTAGTAGTVNTAGTAGTVNTGPDLCVILDPGRPVRTPEMIAAALDHLARRGGDALLSVHESDETLWLEDGGGFGRLGADDGSSGRSRQPASRPNGPQWAENRALVITHAARLREWGQPLGGRIVLHRIPRASALQLLCEDDWCAGEAVYRRLWAGRTATQLAAIHLLVFDFDGVMTDNRVVVFEDGREGVLCSRGDGMGMDLLRASGLAVAVISKEGNPVVSARCRKLKIPCLQGIGDKLPVLRTMVDDHGIDLQAVAYMGNDINDLECMEAVGLAIAPADAEALILNIAGLVTTKPGGFGAVREVADLFVAARQEPNGG